MKTLSRLLTYLNPYRKELAGAFFCMLIYSICNVGLIAIIGRVSEAIGNKDFLMLNIAALVALAVYFLRGIASYGQEYLMHFAGYRVITDIRLQVYSHMQDLSLDFFAKWRTGEIISRLLSDIQIIQTTITTTATGFAPNILTLIGTLIYLFYLNWRLTILTLIVMPVIGLLVSFFGKQIRGATISAQSKVADVSSIIQEKVSGIRVIKSFAMEKHEIEKFKTENESNFWAVMKLAQIHVTQAPLLAFVQMLAVIALVWYGGYEVVSGRLSPANLISFFGGIALLANPVAQLGTISTSIQSALVSAERLFEVIDIKPTVLEKEDVVRLQKIEGRVEFKNVSFSYDGKNPVLKDISLIANPGEIIALVGRSGSGKTTLVNLLPRFYDASSGKILIDGHEIKDLQIFNLRTFMGIVPQETILFSGTIRDNIAYAKMDASQDEIERVSRMANAHKFITTLPEGYDTVVGEKGARLSGGEKQRGAIARALLRDPKILIFDEATSSLDTESEKLVQEAIDALMKNRTTFVIAHRLSTVQNADRILVLDKGEITEEGKHSELILKDGIYKRLYELQFKDEGTEPAPI